MAETPRRRLPLLQRLRRPFVELMESSRQAGAALAAHRLRTTLTALGIAVGVATVIAIASIIAGLNSSFARQVAALGPHTLFVSSRPWIIRGDWWKYRNRPAVGWGDLRALREGATHLTMVVPKASTNAVVSRGDERVEDIEVDGTEPEYAEASNLRVGSGRFLGEVDATYGRDVVVLGADVAEHLFPGESPLGGEVKLGAGKFEVIGVLERRGKLVGRSLDALAVIPARAFARHFGARRGLTLCAVAKDGEVAQAEDEIVALLRRYRRLAPEVDDNFAVNKQESLLRFYDQTTGALYGVAVGVGLIALIVGGIGIMNILLVSVKERTREIGVRRALGARRRTILSQFLIEALALSCLGGLTGTALGIGAATLAAFLTPVAAAASPVVVLVGVAFSASVGLLFGAWPAWSAANLTPVEALRYE